MDEREFYPVWKTTVVKHLKEREELRVLYRELWDLFCYFYNLHEATDEVRKKFEEEFSEYLVEIHIELDTIYATCAPDPIELANEVPWVNVDAGDIGDFEKFVAAVESLPDVE